MLEGFPVIIYFMRTNTWNNRFFLRPVGNTASWSFPETSGEMASFCSDSNARGTSNSESASYLGTCTFTFHTLKFHHIYIQPKDRFKKQNYYCQYFFQIGLLSICSLKINCDNYSWKYLMNCARFRGLQCFVVTRIFEKCAAPPSPDIWHPLLVQWSA